MLLHALLNLLSTVPLRSLDAFSPHPSSVEKRVSKQSYKCIMIENVHKKEIRNLQGWGQEASAHQPVSPQ